MNPNKRHTGHLDDARCFTKQASNRGASKLVRLLKRKLKKRAAREELKLALKQEGL